jgi:hypothetical protein
MEAGSNWLLSVKILSLGVSRKDGQCGKQVAPPLHSHASSKYRVSNAHHPQQMQGKIVVN